MSAISDIKELKLPKAQERELIKLMSQLARRLKFERRVQVRILKAYAARHRNSKTGTWDSKKNLRQFVRMTAAIDAKTAKIRKFSKARKFSYDPY